jgi:pimeloyl-ACP methyl ester carboxylesterase
MLPSAPSHLDLMWIDPGYTQVLRRLGSFARMVIFDTRGVGLSDPLDHIPTVEEGADDLEAVMDAARVKRAVLPAMGTAYPAAAMFAARAPDRVDGLVLVSPWAVGIAAVQNTSTIVGYDERMHQALTGWQDAVEHHWGEEPTIELVARSIVTERVKRNWGMLERAAASPAMIRAVTRAALEIDLREVLTAIRVPTTVVAREGSLQPRAIPEHVADLISDAEFDWQRRRRRTTAWRGSWDHSSTRSSAWRPVAAPCNERGACWPPWYSPTSSARPSGRAVWATTPGAICRSAMNLCFTSTSPMPAAAS